MWVISAVGLYVLVSVFAAGVAATARFRILFIAIAAVLMQILIGNALPSLRGSLLAIVASLAFIVVALVLWCGVGRKAALKIAASYFALCVALVVLAVAVSGFLR